MVAWRPGDGPQLPPGIASVADKLEQVGVERLLVRTADTVRSSWINLEGGALYQLCGFWAEAAIGTIWSSSP